MKPADAVRDAYDELAPDYDFDFTASSTGRLQRDAVWRLLDGDFEPGGRLLDLGCGTGEDASRLARQGFRVHGIDISPRMVALAEERTQAEGLDDRLSFEALSLEEIGRLPDDSFDGAYSNFSALNCVEELRPLAEELADRIHPGGVVALCVMNKRCLWETLLYPLTAILHRTSLDRTSRPGGDWVGRDEGAFPVRYPSVGEIREAFAPAFTLERAPGVGVFTPPTYLEPFARSAPRLMRVLAALDKLLADKPGFRAWGDHRLVVLRRI